MMKYSDTWWLDWSALPDLLRACERVYDNGSAKELDPTAACFWLVEEEYSSLASLIEEGEVEPSVQPPEAADLDRLVERMREKRSRQNDDES